MSDDHIVEALCNKYFKLTGENPEYGFWSFLEACSVSPDLESLKFFYDHMEEYI